jgi:hypothetical protein
MDGAGNSRPSVPGANQPAPTQAPIAGRLSVSDARHLLRTEGRRSTRELVLDLVLAASLAALTARGIAAGHTLGWHLTLPLLARYLGMLVAMPVMQLALPHPGLAREAKLSLVWLAGFLTLTVVAVVSRVVLTGSGPADRIPEDAASIRRLITESGMAWPLVMAFCWSLISVPLRVLALHRFGPPFVGAGLGCGLQFLLLGIGLFALPFLVREARALAWTIWSLLTLADLSAPLIHLDLARRLRSGSGPSNVAD